MSSSHEFDGGGSLQYSSILHSSSNIGHMTAFMYNLKIMKQGLTFSYKNHRIDSCHITLVRIKVDSRRESGDLFLRTFVSQRMAFFFFFFLSYKHF